MNPLPSLRWPLACLAVLMLAGCDFLSPPVVTPGGFGDGDPASVPAFQSALATGRPVVKEPLPKVGGGNGPLIRALLQPAAISAGQHARNTDATMMRSVIQQAVGRPSATPARLFFVSRAYAFPDGGNPVVLLICDPCATAALAMQPAGKDGDVVLSPQFDLSPLGPLFAP